MESIEKQKFPLFATVILELAIGKMLDYGVPCSLASSVKKGAHVLVPVRGKSRRGIVAAVNEGPSAHAKLQPIEKVLAEDLLTPDLLELALWMGNYYSAPLGQVLKSILPASVRDHVAIKEQFFVARNQSRECIRSACIALREEHPSQARVLEILLSVKKGIFLSELLEKAEVSKSPVESLEKKGFLTLGKIQINRSPLVGEEYFKSSKKTLNAEQKQAFDVMIKDLDAKRFAVHLLHGVTGSGKTEVYLQVIEKALSQERGVIMLVPEISLTAQTIERFRSRFEDKIAILHHRLSQGERSDEWRRIKQGQAQIVIGARSAVFSPVQNLGLIIVDEEHDGAYKQSDESPCYHARDVAIMRAKFLNGLVILGSATPSIESFHNAEKGKFHLSTLSQRPEHSTLAKVTLVDMQKEYDKAKGLTSFSDLLLEGIKSRVAKGEQTLLFLNRRGYHTCHLCQKCGHIEKCPHCDMTLTFHLGEQTLSCHLCDFRISPAKKCAQCHSDETMKYRGVGTEHVERALHAIFPEVRTIRVDADTTRHKGSHEKLFRDFSTGKGDVLIGTQMVAKGLHFPAVTLVAILNGDAGLQIPDFRASETAFQLITQVAGRSGRGALAGEVIIQTRMPDHSLIQLASKQDYENFFKQEISVRKYFDFPPFTHLVKVIFQSENFEKLQQAGQNFRTKLLTFLSSNFLIHPLVPSGHPKINNVFRCHCLIRGPSALPINEAIQKVISSCPMPHDVRLSIDVDPLSTFF